MPLDASRRIDRRVLSHSSISWETGQLSRNFALQNSIWVYHKLLFSGEQRKARRQSGELSQLIRRLEVLFGRDCHYCWPSTARYIDGKISTTRLRDDSRARAGQILSFSLRPCRRLRLWQRVTQRDAIARVCGCYEILRYHVPRACWLAQSLLRSRCITATREQRSAGQSIPVCPPRPISPAKVTHRMFRVPSSLYSCFNVDYHLSAPSAIRFLATRRN